MGKSPKSSLCQNLLLSVVSLVVLFLVLELAIRTWDMVRGVGFSSGDRNVQMGGIKPLRPFRTFGFSLYRTVDGVRFISSRHGELYPLSKPQGTIRIVVFGGSTTENRPAFREEGIHYPLVLQSELRSALGRDNIEVINVANSAYATPHSLIIFELDALSWDPDMIIVSHNINDLTAAYWPEFTFDYSNKYGNEYYSLPDFRAVYTLPNLLFRNSEFYWFVRNRIDGVNADSARELRRRSRGDSPPAQALQTFRRNLKSFVSLAKDNGIRVLFGNQPLQPDEEMFVRHMGSKPYNAQITYPLHSEFLKHHRAYNEAIRQVADENGALFVDNDAVLGGNSRYFVDFVHYTPEGVRVLARNYADYIRRERLIR